MQRIQPLQGREAREFAKMTDEFVRRPLKPLGHCVDCNKLLLPHVLHVVTEWATEDRGGLPTQVPKRYVCADCGADRREKIKKPVRHPPQQAHTAVEPVEEALTPKEIALRLLKATSSEPHGSKWLAKAAGLEYGDYVLALLRKLRDAGKLTLEEGKWARA